MRALILPNNPGPICFFFLLYFQTSTLCCYSLFFFCIWIERWPCYVKRCKQVGFLKIKTCRLLPFLNKLCKEEWLNPVFSKCPSFQLRLFVLLEGLYFCKKASCLCRATLGFGRGMFQCTILRGWNVLWNCFFPSFVCHWTFSSLIKLYLH